MNALSIRRPRPSIETRTQASSKQPANPRDVNWQPRSVLKIFGGPDRSSASSTTCGQKSVSSVSDDFATQHHLSESAHHPHHVRESPLRRKVGDVRAPPLLGLLDRQVPQRVWIDPVSCLPRPRAQLAVDRLEAYLARRPPHLVPIVRTPRVPDSSI